MEDLFLPPVNCAFSVHVASVEFKLEVEVVKLARVASDVDVASQDLLSLHLSFHLRELC